MERLDTKISPEQRIRKLFKSSGSLRSRELVAAGISRSQISRMVATARLERVTRGLYSMPEHPSNELSTLATIAKRAPRVVFCLLTALRFHHLTSQAPFEVWIAVSNKDYPPRLDYPPLRTLRFSGKALTEGVETHTVLGTKIQVTSVAKTVADCFKFRNKVGVDVALEALREAHRTKTASADDLWKFAKIDRVSNIMRPYLEAVS